MAYTNTFHIEVHRAVVHDATWWSLHLREVVEGIMAMQEHKFEEMKLLPDGVRLERSEESPSFDELTEQIIDDFVDDIRADQSCRDERRQRPNPN